MIVSYTLRYMSGEDIPQVVEIDKLSFPSPWSARSYAFEITDNPSSHMIVLVENGEVTSGSGWRGVLNWLRGQPHPQNVLGYGGMWVIDGEAHISTIAVHPDYRGRGLGEILMNGMITRALDLKSEYVVLEVRTTNENAKALYRKYGFAVVGIRKNYYRDNNEDAEMMNLEPLDAAYRTRLAALTRALHQRLLYFDQLASTAPPRPVSKPE